MVGQALSLAAGVSTFSLVETQVGQTIGFRGLLGWAFGPRNFMKNWLAP
jgi:hypothetical protein